jgi:DNA-directed RNA polymerase alpha subunit
MTLGDEVLNAPLSALGLSYRARHALLDNGFGTVGDVVAKTTVQLSKLPRLGPASVAEIKAKLNARGLSLRELGGGALPPKNWRRDNKLLRASVSVLGLRIRVYHALLKNGFSTVGDVVANSEIELSRMHYLGPASLAHIKAKLSTQGLTLRPAGKVAKKK